MQVRVIAFCVAVQVVLVALNLLSRVAGLDSPILDIETESNPATWWSSFQFGLAGLAAAAVVVFDAGPALVWGPIAGAMGFFSLDEVAQLHEKFEESVGGSWVVTALEPLVALGILAFAVYALRRLGKAERILLVLAAVALVAANVSGGITESVTTESSVLEHAFAVQEELCEMLVGTFVLAAALPNAIEGLRGYFAAQSVTAQSAARHSA